MRPRVTVFVTGTGTDIGKTWLSVAILQNARGRHLRVAARKPVQSFDPSERVTDADLLGDASGEPPATVCPDHRWYGVPMAPPMAAASLGAPPPLIADLIQEIDRSWPDPAVDLGLVEGAGGVASPLASDGDSAALAMAISPNVVVLVADAGLGTINSVRLSRTALEPLPVVVYLNRFDHEQELHERNRAWLAEVDGLEVSCDRDDLAGRVLALAGV